MTSVCLCLVMNEEVSIVSCMYCSFKCYDDIILRRHVVAVHKNESNIRFYCNYCGVSYKNWDSLRKHVQRLHRVIQDEATPLQGISL